MLRKGMFKDEKAISSEGSLIVIVIGSIIVAAIYFACTVSIPAGHVGVPDRFGVVGDEERPPGFGLKDPLTHYVIMNYQTQQYEYKAIAGTLTKEGVEVTPDVSVSWHLDPTKASDIYSTVKGGEYFETLITPAFMGILRDEMKRWTVEDFYTGTASQIQDDTFRKLRDNLASRGVIIEAVWFRGSQIPPIIKAAIEQKIKEKQELEQMGFTVDKRKQEAAMMLITANATSTSNIVVAKSVTPELIQWEFVQALKANKNVMYVTTGAGGSPSMILPAAGKNP